jgi:hypothetical protein
MLIGYDMFRSACKDHEEEQRQKHAKSKSTAEPKPTSKAMLKKIGEYAQFYKVSGL